MEDQKSYYDQRKDHSGNVGYDQHQDVNPPEMQHPGVMRSPAQNMLTPTSQSPDSVNSLKRAAPDSPEDDDDDDDDDEDDEPDRKKLKGEDGGVAKKKKAGGSGRRRIEIKFIENKSRRQVTFSRRKRGLMKKAYELTTLTGTQALVLIASETGHVYTFATPKLQPVVTLREGKELIQSCLNAPDTNYPAEYSMPPPNQSSQQGGGSSGNSNQNASLPKPEPHSHTAVPSSHHHHDPHMMAPMYNQSGLPGLHHPSMGHPSGPFHPAGMGGYGPPGMDQHGMNYLPQSHGPHGHPHSHPLASMVPLQGGMGGPHMGNMGHGGAGQKRDHMGSEGGDSRNGMGGHHNM